jgi:RND family efflux transporter MFP subunit
MTLKISRQTFSKRGVLGTVVLVLFLAIGIFWAIRHVAAQPSGSHDAGAALVVAGVAKVTRQDLSKEVTIAAEFRPYVEAELNAKVSGYISRMKVDCGDKVIAGQLLATIEVPELEAQFVNAQALEQKAEADYTNANLIYTRLVSVNKAHPDLVAQQDLDTAEANARVAVAAIAATKADVERYQTLVSYTNITAPFDGVITRRYVDAGQLVQSGTAAGRPLLRVSDNYRLRLDFPVTVDYVKDIQLGDPVTVRVESLNNKALTGDITRFTQDIDDNTRTMITEIEVPNSGLELKPGMYATVVLKVEKRPGALAVPVQAVSGGKSPVVLFVNRNNEIEERAIKLGLETPDNYEVLSGLQEGDLVIIGNRAAYQPGQKVEPKLVQVSMRDEN